ncbi:transposase [Methylobacterium sp. W2]|uniref:transposase n=1 Tax=Methylobacterium sp. W2 TaxID=2598107 RepID=UPI001D0CBDEC|nr:transposase [Methylobacterium sp. W2]
MRRSRHTDQEVAFLLKEAEDGIPVATICEAAHISVGTFYRWRRRLGGLPPAGVVHLGAIERENAALRAELVRLRQSLLALSPRHPDSTGHPIQPGHHRPGTPSASVGSVRYRGGAVSVGRYAFVRGAN